MAATGASKTLLRVGASFALLLGLAFALWYGDVGGVRGTGALRMALTERGRVAVERLAELPIVGAPGATLLELAAVPGLRAALDGRDPALLARVLERQQVDALLLLPSVGGTAPALRGGASSTAVAASAKSSAASLLERLHRYEPLAGLRGLQLSPRMALRCAGWWRASARHRSRRFPS